MERWANVACPSDDNAGDVYYQAIVSSWDACTVDALRCSILLVSRHGATVTLAISNYEPTDLPQSERIAFNRRIMPGHWTFTWAVGSLAMI